MVAKTEISRRGALGLAVGALGAGGLLVTANPALAEAAIAVDTGRIDAVIASFLSALEIPGMAVAITRPDEAPYVRGYGVRTLGKPEPVDINTLFAIASNSKAFTAAALAILVEQGKIGWDEPVIKYMPDFAMHDPVATRMMTVRDLLVHRSGLPYFAGDLMWFAKGDHSPLEMLRALRHFPLTSGFRAGYTYDNILYTVVGLLIERVSGVPVHDFVTKNIFSPLGMENSVANLPAARKANIAARHARIGPPVPGAGPLAVVEADETAAVAAAAGVHASVSDIVPWLQTQLGKGQAAGLPRLWSEAQSAEMWSPQVISSTSTGGDERNPVRPIIQGSALGWYVQEFRGHRMVWNAGLLTGQASFVAMLPEQNIALAVLTNSENYTAAVYAGNALLDTLIGAPPFDWAGSARRAFDKGQAALQSMATAKDLEAPSGGPSLPLAAYAGRYRDAWYGDIVIREKSGRLMIDFTRTSIFKGALEPWGTDAFRTRWTEVLGEDAIVFFTLSGGAVTGMKVKALSPDAVFSYDYRAFDPRRVP